MLTNYGKFVINLETMMKEKKISKNQLCNLTGLTFTGLQRYYKNTLQRVDLDILARICNALECNIEDIIQYIPKKNNRS